MDQHIRDLVRVLKRQRLLPFNTNFGMVYIEINDNIIYYIVDNPILIEYKFAISYTNNWIHCGTWEMITPDFYMANVSIDNTLIQTISELIMDNVPNHQVGCFFNFAPFFNNANLSAKYMAEHWHNGKQINLE